MMGAIFSLFGRMEIPVFVETSSFSRNETSTTRSYSPSSSSSLSSCTSPSPLSPFTSRNDIGALLEERKFQVGAQVGVQAGLFSKQLLEQWKSCRRMHLIDLWEHYKTNVANIDTNTTHEAFLLFQQTQENVQPWNNKVKFHRMSSIKAAQFIGRESLDFVYINSRPDYCSVTEDIKAYWPLLKPGGIMAGQNFRSADEVLVAAQNEGGGGDDGQDEDWSQCVDGSKHMGAVKGAVLDFMTPRGIQVAVSYQDDDWPSWMVLKPPNC